MNTEPTITEETKIEDIADSLYRRITEETRKKLWPIALKAGVKSEADFIQNGERKVFPSDDLKLAEYWYKDTLLLTVRIADSRMGIEFDVHEIETQEREVQ